MVALIALFLVALAGRQYSYHQGARGLVEQREAIERLQADYGDEARFVAFGAPGAMALLGSRNANRYGHFLTPALLRHLEAREPGGFAGWLESLSEQQPDVLIVHRSTGYGFDEDQARAWRRWLRAYERRPRAGEWIVLERKDRRPPRAGAGTLDS